MTKLPIGYPIKGVKSTENRPFWSVMIPTYNASDYLRETLKCVLAQNIDVEKMQIMVVDDASTEGDTEKIVQEIGQGRIEYYRQPKNLGQTGNWNTCLELAKGYWIHLLHDDDLILEGFYQTLKPALRENKELGAAFCRFQIINQESQPIWLTNLEREKAGILENFIDDVAINSKIQPPSIVVKREVYEKLGGFHQDLPHTPDWEMWQRIATFYPIWYEPEVLACYRENPMKALKKGGEDLMMFRKSIDIAETYLPPEKGLSQKAREAWAMFGMRRAYRMMLTEDWEATGILLRETLNLSASPLVLQEWMTLFSRSYPYDFTGLPQWEKLPGDFSLEKATAIQSLVKNKAANCRLLEIGAFEGKSTVVIAHGMSPHTQLTSVIPLPELKQGWGEALNEKAVVENFDQVLKQFGCRHKVKILAMGIDQALQVLKDELFELIFLNFPCNYAQALTYLKQFYPKLKPNGLLLCNYYEMRYQGIIRATNEMGLKGGLIVKGLWIHQKQ